MYDSFYKAIYYEATCTPPTPPVIHELFFVYANAVTLASHPPTPNGSKGLAIPTAVQDLAWRVLQESLLAAIGPQNFEEAVKAHPHPAFFEVGGGLVCRMNPT